MEKLTRRGWIAAAAGLSVSSALGAGMRHEPKHGRGHIHHHKHLGKAGSDPDSLNGAAFAKGLMFGSALGAKLRAPAGMTALKPFEGKRAAAYDDPRMRALFAAQCGILVPENELKWYALRPEPGKFDFSGADLLMDFSTRSGLAVRGHTLLWNRAQYMPPWVLKHDFAAPAAAEKMLREHVQTICTRYGERIFSYDVINETVAPDTGELEDSPFTKALGPNLIDVCFHAAREFAPHAQLVYNDYMSWGRAEAVHRAGVLKLLERMKRDNVPVDALGIQSHIGTNDLGASVGPLDDVDEADWRKFLDEVTAMGLDLVITELDVNDRYIVGDVATRDRIVAAHAKAFLDIALSYPQLRYVMAWGLVDKYSWLRSLPPRFDGLPRRPTPYDDEFNPKPLRQAIIDAFADAPDRVGLDAKPA